MGLVLTRKLNSAVILKVGEEEICITVVRCRNCDVRLNIVCGEKVKIRRAEISQYPDPLKLEAKK